MSAPLGLTAGIARSWAAVYTLGLPGELRDARRGELDSDLWEQQQFASLRRDPDLGTAVEILLRTLLGMISDITWRAQARGATRAERSIKVTELWYMRGLGAVAVGAVLALLLILTGFSWPWVVIMIPIGVALVAFVAIALRTAQTPSNMRIGVDHMRTKRKSRRKWLLLVIGVCVATVVGSWAYAITLEEWGEGVTIIFFLVVLPAIAIGLVALFLLISDLTGTRRRDTDS